VAATAARPSGAPRASGAASKIVVLLGPPGAGKGTQAEKLATALEIPKVATGDVLRSAVREGTELGKAAKGFMDRGELVPDDLILGVMREALARPQAKRGAILDGVIRTVPQARGLKEALAKLGRDVSAVVVFHVPEEELIRRISGRVVCEACQTAYSGLGPGDRCPKDGGRLVRRPDDEPEAVRRRLAVYRSQTEPVIDWYRKHGARVISIDAVGTPDEVRDRLLRALGWRPRS
jgi:adenylate kinase